MKLKTLTFPHDVYSRHATVSKFIQDSKSVLDVGGSLKQLNLFIANDCQLFTTDVVGGDVIYDGKHLPFKTNSLDTVVSIDTIEHIHQSKRLSFIQEMARVAKKQLIIAAPLGTPLHIQAEKLQLKSQKSPDKYLSEHVKYGLPQLKEIKLWLSHFPKHQFIFAGNHKLAQILFAFHQTQIKLPKIGRFWYEFKKIIYIIINLSLYWFYKSRPLSPNINRFYITIKL